VTAWRLERDIITLGPLRVALQRIAVTHWQPAGALRSWGLVPLHRDDDRLLAPAYADEALWIGAWLEDAATQAELRVIDPLSGVRAELELPRDYQLAALPGPDGDPQPVARATATERSLRIQLACGTDRAEFDLVLLEPEDWSARSGQPPTVPLSGPPPPPPRLG
jgi:hypothetical protein